MVGTDVHHAAALLRAGNVVGIPTETVYGLAANALDAKAVARVFAIKGRPSFDPLIIHIGQLSQAVELTQPLLPEVFYRLSELFWPGPLTLVVKKSDKVPDIVTAGLDTVGLRMPNHPMTLELLQYSNLPLAAPSANPFGYISPVTAQHVEQQLGTQIPYVLDGGRCEVGIESTIVDCTSRPVRILRKGGISIEQISQVIGYMPDVQTQSSDNPRAPGMLTSHYAPRKKLILTDNTKLFNQFAGRADVAFLLYNNPMDDHPIQRILTTLDSDLEAAANLFYYLREFDEMPHVTLIIAEKAPDSGLGMAINDRLSRAAANP
ncbi:MAG: L-threonylcarbamoyladenylate synthase [Thermaurantimonas sp.]